MEGNSGVNIRDGDGNSSPCRVQEEINKQDDHHQHVFFRGWSKTGKRKEKCTRARVNITDFSQDEEESSRPGKEKIKKRKASESPRASNAGDHVHSPSSGRSLIMQEPGNDGVPDHHDDWAERAVLLDHGDYNNPTQSRDHEHVCNICNRSFKSYQALGGHKAHHNSDDKGEEDVSFTEEKSGSASGRPRKTNQLHQCTVCNRIFSQGQALGGHKRHCRGPASRGRELGTESRPRVPDFDLNQLPPEWIPDE